MGGEQKIKPCKTPNCGKTRFRSFALCFRHYQEKIRLRKEEKKSRKLARKIASKTFQKSERKKWHAKCWKLISELVRRQGADFQGYVRCYTCPARLNWKEMNAGHWRHGVLDFDERNLKPQCPKCNLYLSGRLDEYTLRLTEQYGLEWVRELKIAADRHPGYSLDDLRQIYSVLSMKIAALPQV